MNAELPGLDALRRVARCAVVGVSVRGSRRTTPIGSATTSTPFRIASLTKPVTALATVLAARSVGCALATPVLDLLPSLHDVWVADPRVTIADVLSQTSGLRSTVSADDVARLGTGDDVAVAAARLVGRAGSARPPGTSWEYDNGNYFVAGAVLAALAGTTYEDALDRLVLRPWGLGATSFAPPDNLAGGIDGGQPVPDRPYPRGRRPSGGLCSTATDLLTFGERLLDDVDVLGQVAVVRTRPDDAVRYGLGWAVGPSGQLYLNGRLPGFRSALLLVPDHDLVGVVLAADSDALPAAARVLDGLQRGVTGDDLGAAIDGFAA